MEEGLEEDQIDMEGEDEEDEEDYDDQHQM
jgi:hypothetical protein